MKSSKGFLLLLAVCLLALLATCRRNQPSLIDRNQPPETELWYAPPDSTEYEYKVHMYWRGLDRDGRVLKYIWVKTDTIEAEDENKWNPAESLDDYRMGRITTRTDSVFSFTAYKRIGEFGLRKNRQAFHVAAIDNNGVIDETPAAIEFVATIDKLPEMRFATVLNWTTDGQGNYIPLDTIQYDPANLDTVGMYRPFAILYDGATTNGEVRAYQWYPITNIDLPGAFQWTEDLTDNFRFFLNDVNGLSLPSGIFRLAALCKDDAGAESYVDPGTYAKGVCEVVVNFDPDTEIYDIRNIYKTGGVVDTMQIDFADGVPDTVPYRSWITLRYRGWDHPNDVVLCDDDVNKCIKYKIRYIATSERIPNTKIDSNLLPQEGAQDTNPCGVDDSTSMNIGTVEYEIIVHSLDENSRKDGIPKIAMVGGQQKTAVVRIVGNFDPTLDSLYLEDHKGRKIQFGDTLKWSWAEGDRTFVLDDTSQAGFHWTTTLSFSIKAFGHDHPKEIDGSGVKSWYYYFRSVDPPDIYKKFAKAENWVGGSALNQLDDKFEVVFHHAQVDPDGDAVFSNPPNWIGVNYGGENNAILYELTLKGRDTEIGEFFTNYVFLRRFGLQSFDCPPDPNQPISQRTLIDDYPTARLGRWTQEGVFRFYFQLVP